MFLFVLDCPKPGTSLSSEFFNSPLPGNVAIVADEIISINPGTSTLNGCQDLCINFNGEHPCKVAEYSEALEQCILYIISPLTDLGVLTTTNTQYNAYIRKCL